MMHPVALHIIIRAWQKKQFSTYFFWPVAEWDACIQHGSWHLFDCPESCIRWVCSDGALLYLSPQQVGPCGDTVINDIITRQFCMENYMWIIKWMCYFVSLCLTVCLLNCFFHC